MLFLLCESMSLRLLINLALFLAMIGSGIEFRSLEMFAGAGQWTARLQSKGWQTQSRDILLAASHNVLLPGQDEYVRSLLATL